MTEPNKPSVPPTYRPASSTVTGGGIVGLAAVGIAVAVGLAVLGFLLLGAYFYILVTAGSTSHQVDQQGVTATIAYCSRTDGTYRAVVTVTNNTQTTQSVTVTAEWQDAGGGRLASDDVVVHGLAPGQSTTEEVQATGVTSASDLLCRAHVR